MLTPMQIIAACDDGPDAMVAAGLPRPATLKDVVLTMWAAQDRLTAPESRALASRDRMQLDYAASATKVVGAAPQMKTFPFPI